MSTNPYPAVPGSCCALGCRSSSYKDWELTFFKFPLKQPRRLEAWLKVCSLNHMTEHKTAIHRLCSNHFKPEQYYYDPRNPKPKLVWDAIPTLFVQYHQSPNPVIANQPPQTADEQSFPEFIGPDDMIVVPRSNHHEETGHLTTKIGKTSQQERDALIQENAQLKVRVEELKNQLTRMSNQVHILNKTTGQLDRCVCSNCLPK